MSMTKRDLNKFLAQIRDSDQRQVEAQFDIANVLTAIKDHELFRFGGYESFKMMVQAEVDFTPSCAMDYVSLHTQYSKYSYNKTEFLKLMKQFGWRRVNEALRESKKHMGYRAMNAWMKARDVDSSRQFNFNVPDKQTVAKLESILTRFGMEVPGQGRRSHMTEAFIAMMEDYERLQKNAHHTTGKPKRNQAKAA